MNNHIKTVYKVRDPLELPLDEFAWEVSCRGGIVHRIDNCLIAYFYNSFVFQNVIRENKDDPMFYNTVELYNVIYAKVEDEGRNRWIAYCKKKDSAKLTNQPKDNEMYTEYLEIEDGRSNHLSKKCFEKIKGCEKN